MNDVFPRRTKVTRKYVFELYEKVRKGDLAARGRFIDLHAQSFPDKTALRVDQHPNNLHQMYMQLERKFRDVV